MRGKKKKITNKDLMEFMAGMKEKMATKEDIARLDAKIDSAEGRLTIRLDFITKEVADIKERLDKLAKRTKDDDRVLFTEIERLKKRVKELEQTVAIMRKS